ncbi:hypothetical protein AF335_04965 [Streptomyces eurocidicus]|uniref:Uncharacterized protein n=1 Tax=Streptomyces eurocidicus TaxID=66423 RepID=A0A2N8NZ40_STREU|nr:hypothetical protein AF335_28955 [Streptomyces eurocidicus]PNE34033.1 hypothetical protein AF335_04965 [Streptomyces eurocidicus]
MMMMRYTPTSWGLSPLACSVCEAQTGLTLISAESEVLFTCPTGHTSRDWRLTPDAEVRAVGVDVEFRVTTKGGALSSQRFDDGDGEDDFRDLPL